MNQLTKFTHFTALQECFTALVKSTRRNIYNLTTPSFGLYVDTMVQTYNQC